MVHLHLHLHLDLILHLNLNTQVAHIESRLPRDRDILVHCKTGNALSSSYTSTLPYARLC